MSNTLPTCTQSGLHTHAIQTAQGAMRSEKDCIALASLYKLFGDPTRIRILHALEQSELCVCDLASLLSLTKSAVSHQLKELRLSNLVKFRRAGQVIFYSLADEHVRSILEIGFAHLDE